MYEEKKIEITQQFVDSVSNYNRIYPYSEGFAIVRKGKYYGFVDAMGKQLTPCIYDQARLFMNGIAAVSRADKDGKWGFVDAQGKEVIPMQYNVAFPFNEGEVAQVSYKRVYGLIDKNGNGTFKEE